MFCVTMRGILGLAPYPVDTDPAQQEANRAYFEIDEPILDFTLE